MDLLEATDRLSALVMRNLQGATLLEFTQVEECVGEVAFAVLWKRPMRKGLWEYGTHRAVLSTHNDTSMLVWGHYWPDMPSHAIQDYKRRGGLVPSLS